MKLNRDKVVELYKLGCTYEQIANMMNVKAATVRKCISRNFNELSEEQKNKKFNEIEDMYKKGCDSSEIGRKLGLASSTIRDYICEHFKQFKNLHEENKKEKKKLHKELIGLINKEDNRYMNTEELIKQNRQSFIYIDGMLVYDHTRGARPGDLPNKHYA